MGLEEAANGIATDVEFAHVGLNLHTPGCWYEEHYGRYRGTIRSTKGDK